MPVQDSSNSGNTSTVNRHVVVGFGLRVNSDFPEYDGYRYAYRFVFWDQFLVREFQNYLMSEHLLSIRITIVWQIICFHLLSIRGKDCVTKLLNALDEIYDLCKDFLYKVHVMDTLTEAERAELYSRTQCHICKGTFLAFECKVIIYKKSLIIRINVFFLQ